MTATTLLESLLEAAVGAARAEGRSTLLEHEAYAFLPLLGLEAPRHVFIPASADPAPAARDAAAALAGNRIVLKIVASDVLHKTERGGVALVEANPAAIEAAIADLLARFEDADVRGVLAVERVPYDPSLGSELLLGIRNTADFGPTVTFGAGGVLAEALDRELQPGRGAAIFGTWSSCGAGVPPASRLEASRRQDQIEQILRRSFVTSIVTGTARGQTKRMDLRAIRDVIAAALAFADRSVPDPIAEIEVNPFVASNGRAVALDALVKLTTGDAPPRPVDRPLEKIDRLLRPSSIAVAGVSKAMNPGRIIVTNLLAAGFDRDRITIIKPVAAHGVRRSPDELDAIDGCRYVPDLESLPAPVDLLVLAISSDQIPDAIERAIAARAAESIIVIPGGMGEREGSESLEARVRAAIAAARATPWRGPVVNGGNCLGILSRPGNVDTIFLPSWKLRAGAPASHHTAPLALVSQSGAFAVAKTTKLGGLEPRYSISIGNQVDLTMGDYLQFLGEDPEVRVFAFYAEGFRPLDGRAWLRAAERIARAGRTVILYRAGRTPEGSRASASHTAAIAGDAAVARELAAAAGVVVAESLDEFEDFVRLFTLLSSRPLSGNRLAAMSNAGFETVAFADSLSGFALASIGASTRAQLEEIVRGERLERVISIANPLDVNPMMTDAAFARAAAALLGDDGVDAGIVGCVPLTPALVTLPPGAKHREDVAAPGSVASRLAEVWRTSTKPWVAVVDSGSLYDPMVTVLESAGVPVFRTADRALRAFARWAGWTLAHRARA